MKLARRPDWASRKAHAIIDRDCLRRTLPDEIAKALSQERRRAVRKCHSLGKHGKHLKGDKMCAMYIEACDDCAQAIAGGK